jgi:uncharacterized protein (TIGR03067 family)
MKTLKAMLLCGLVCGLAVAEDKKPDAKKFDAEKLVGKWTVSDGKKAGGALGDMAKKGYYEISDKKIALKDDNGKDMFVFEYTLDTKVSPVAIDMKITTSPDNMFNDSKAKGIIELDGDTLQLCYDPMGENRPQKFDGEKSYWFKLKREKKDDKKNGK